MNCNDILYKYFKDIQERNIRSKSDYINNHPGWSYKREIEDPVAKWI